MHPSDGRRVSKAMWAALDIAMRRFADTRPTPIGKGDDAIDARTANALHLRGLIHFNAYRNQCWPSEAGRHAHNLHTRKATP